MKKILDDRENLEPKLHEISKFTDEAYKVFEKLRSDLSGDSHMARRYSSEVRNKRDIVDDYIALLEIDTIVKSGDKDANKKVAKIAADRRKNRLELIAEMEDFKEEYLHASHLRNQSIFMQLFADIEAYAKKTPAEIENRCRLMLERTWERGGYALGSGNSIADYISDENYLALIRAAHEFKG
jgi:hypothetical protein